MAEKSNCLLSNCFQYLIVFFVKVKIKELDIGVTFEFELFEPKSLVRSTSKEIARVSLV